MSLFSDDQIRFDLLRKYSINQWGRYPPDVIPLTAADPDFRAAEAIRRAIANMAVDGVFSYFGPGGEGHIRIVYSTSMGIMEEAMDRVEAAVSKL